MLKFYVKFDDYNVNLLLNVHKQIKEAEAKAALEEEKRRQQVTEQKIPKLLSLCIIVSFYANTRYVETYRLGSGELSSGLKIQFL